MPVCQFCNLFSPDLSKHQCQSRKREREASDDRITNKRPSLVAGMQQLAINPSEANREGYALIHTIGFLPLNIFGGDGAYSEWFNRYFLQKANDSNSSCRYCARIVADNDIEFVAKFDARNKLISTTLNPKPKTIILNWHVRFTGRPNSWTGRGINQDLIDRLDENAKQYQLKLIVIYTIHELEGVYMNSVPRADALITLNRDNVEHLKLRFTELNDKKIESSRVPSLMTSGHMTALDQTIQEVRRLCDTGGLRYSQTEINQGHAKYSLEYRINNTQGDVTKRTQKGVIIFGMITERHGTTVSNIDILKRKMYDSIPYLNIIIAGSTTDPNLNKALLEINNTAPASPKIIIETPLNSFNDFTGINYAISFDPHGYRPNASAMVNVMRAGQQLLFYRGLHESPQAFVDRAVREIYECEQAFIQNNSNVFIRKLGRQFSQYTEMSEQSVGPKLDSFFSRITHKVFEGEKVVQ